MVKYGYRGNNFMKLLCGNFAVRIQNDKIFMFYELSCVICNLINGVLYFKRKNNMDQCTIAFTVLRFTVTVFLYQKVQASTSSRTVFVKPGTTALLHCPDRTIGIPTFWLSDKYKWPVADGQTVSSYSREGKFKVEGNFSQGEYNLVITNVAAEDVGKFTCVISRNGNPRQYDIHLDLLVAPSRMTISHTQKSKLYSKEGSTLILACKVHSGRPLETLSWIHDDKIIFSGGPGRLDLSLLASRSHHLKNYTCLANNSAFTEPLKETVTLVIAYKPTVVILGNDVQKVIEGSRVTLECSVESNPAATLVVWKREIDDGFNTKLNNMSVLDLLLINRRDAGNYVCESLNSIGKGWDRIKLDVLYPPEISFVYQNYSTFDEIKQITCLPAGNPQNYTFYKWEHTSEFGEHIRFLKGNDEGVLSLENSLPGNYWYQDSGFYKCSVSNGIPDINGVFNQSKSVFLSIYGKPIILSFPNTIYGIIGELLTVFLDILSAPMLDEVYIDNLTSTQYYTNVNFKAPRVVLKAKFHNVSTRTTGYRVSIEILNLTSDWFKKTIIGVKNTFGKSENVIEVKEATIPEEPLSVNVSAKDINLVVKWQRNFDGGLKQSFYIEYKIKTNDQWSIIKSLNKSTSEILSWTINGLRHDQWYTVRMFSRNKLGESNRTEEIYIKTKGKWNRITITIIITGSAVAGLIVLLVVMFCCSKCQMQGNQTLSNRIISPSQADDIDEHVYHEIQDDLVLPAADITSLTIPIRNLSGISKLKTLRQDTHSGYLTPDPCARKSAENGNEHEIPNNTEITEVNILRKLLAHSNNRTNSDSFSDASINEKDNKPPTYNSLTPDWKNEPKKDEYLYIS